MQSNMSEENIEASKNTANNAIDAYTANISASLTRLTDINTKLTGKMKHYAERLQTIRIITHLLPSLILSNSLANLTV